MKTYLSWALVALVLGLSGCQEGDEDWCEDTGASDSFHFAGIVLVGEQVRVRIAPQPANSSSCGEAPPPPGAIQGQVLGPDRQPVASQFTLGVPASSAATVEFTAQQRGSYTIEASFDGAYDDTTYQVLAVTDRSSQAPLHTLSAECAALERTSRGTWICDTQVVRGSGLERSFPGSRLAVAGDVVWVVDTTQVQRLVDTGTTLELTARMDLPEAPPEFLLASATELMVMHASTFQRIVFDGAALKSTGVTAWTPGISALYEPAPRGLLLRAGDRLATVTRSITSQIRRVEVCPHQLEADRFVSSASCQQFQGEVVGFESHRLWLREVDYLGRFTPKVHVVELSASGALQTRTFLTYLGTSTRPIGHRLAVSPVFLWKYNPSGKPRAAVLALRPGTPLPMNDLEYLDEQLADPLASPTLLWGAAATDGNTPGTRVRLR